MVRMALPIPTPGAVIGLTRSAVGAAAALPARAFKVLDDIETLVSRVGAIADRAEAFLERSEGLADRAGILIDGVDATVTDVESVLERVRLVAAAATAQVEQAARVVAAAGLLVEEGQRLAEGAGMAVAAAGRVTDDAEKIAGTAATLLGKVEPMATRFVDQLSPEEVEAAIKLVDELPRLTRHLDEDILPILATLDRVGPDIHELLEVTRDLQLAVKGIPGLRMLKRRGQS